MQMQRLFLAMHPIKRILKGQQTWEQKEPKQPQASSRDRVPGMPKTKKVNPADAYNLTWLYNGSKILIGTNATSNKTGVPIQGLLFCFKAIT